jgi:antitoxin component of MazEF toxin-antitoxin module
MVTLTEDVKVVRVGNSLRIAIPSVFCKALGIEEGHSLRLTTTNGDILVSTLQHREARKKG